MKYTYTNSTANPSQGEAYTDETEYTSEMVLLTIAMSGAIIKEVEDNYVHFLDDQGYIPLYELIKEITDELLLSKDEVYQRDFLTAENKDDWFNKNLNTCKDWYFMDRAREKLKEKKLE